VIEGAIDLYNYQTLDNRLAAAELELRDQKDTVSTNMKNLYNTIKQSETTIDSQIKELENLKKSLETATNKYELGVIAKADLISYEYAITQQESNILTAIYTHMLNVEKLTTPTLF
ncbi:MAG: TolC family protein, partial [Anaerotignaceae bacterium]